MTQFIGNSEVAIMNISIIFLLVCMIFMRIRIIKLEKKNNSHQRSLILLRKKLEELESKK